VELPGTKDEVALSNSKGADEVRTLSPRGADPDGEKRLLEACRRGDLDAFDRLLSLHQDAVYRTALRLMGDPEEAFDLAQDVLLTAFRKIEQFRGESRFATWLYRITVNLARNRWKSAARKPVILSLDTGADPPGEEETPKTLEVPDKTQTPRDAAAGREMIAALEREIANLPEVYREVIVLRHIEDLSYEEIAQALDANLGTIKSRLARARELLRSALGPALDDFLGQESQRSE